MLLVKGDKNKFPSQKEMEFQNSRGKLKNVIQEYYNKYSNNLKQEGSNIKSSNNQPRYQGSQKNNSPMLIKLLRNEEL